ncbi:MAG: Yip1 family protein [Steroidobacteraceae bacterium]|jgi:hypothetical protein|nr:Yip1 family protein [Steroidobacteraceae bacterium]
MDFNKLVARVKGMLLAPRQEWPAAASEPATPADLYKNYIVLLAALPVVFGFIKMSLIGVSTPFTGTLRTAVGAGIGAMLLSYVLALAGVYVIALIVDALAPTFGGQKDRTQALKTVAYAYTASWVAGVAQIVPGIGLLIAFAGGVYSIYLLYLGLPHTMKCPQEKAAGYTAVTIIVALVLSFLFAAVVGAVVGVGSAMRGASIGASSDKGQFDPDSPLGQMERWGKQVEQAGKRLEEAQRSGDEQAQADALRQMMGAAFGGDGSVESLPPERLRAFAPASLAGLERSDLTVQRNSAMGMQISEVRAVYGDADGRTLELEITDTGTAQALLAFAGWAGMESESESSSGYEKTYRDGGRLVHEQWDRDASWGEYSVVVGERFTVKVSGAASGVAQLRRAANEVDLRGLEALRDHGVKRQ